MVGFCALMIDLSEDDIEFIDTLKLRSGDGCFSIDNVIFSEGNHHQRHPIPAGLKVSRVFIDGKLAREGSAYDYVIKTDGINTWLKTTVEPTASTEIAVIGEQE